MSVVKIGSNVNNVTDVLIEPHVEFMIGATQDKNVANQARFVGNPRCRFTYPDRLLTGEQYYQLKSLVGTKASANVVMDIPTQTLDTDTYQPQVITYSAIMHWPEDGVKLVSHNRWEFPDGILFTNLEPI